MSKAVHEKLDKILEKLRWIHPDVYSFPVNSLEMDSGIHFVPVKDIAYITSDVPEKIPFKLQFAMADGKAFYSNLRLAQVEKKLGDDPRFMRSQKSYIINFQWIRKMDYSKARDLWFADYPDPLLNAVSLNKLDEFKDRFEDVLK